jgi:hypothetical protein
MAEVDFFRIVAVGSIPYLRPTALVQVQGVLPQDARMTTNAAKASQ